MARGRKDHTVCHVSFEDYDGRLHRVTLRVPRKLPLTHSNMVKLLLQKTDKRVGVIVGEECTTSRRSKSHRLPRRR